MTGGTGTYSSKEELNTDGDLKMIAGDGGGTSSNTVEVRGLSAGTSQEVLEMYFENSRRSGGGDIEEVQIKDGIAYITFVEAETAQRVVSRSSHQVAGQTLTVTLYHPPPIKPCYDNRILVQELNSAVTGEILTNFLETEIGAKVTEILYGEEVGRVVVTFSSCIDFNALRKACSETRIKSMFLQVAKVVISNCILVWNIQLSASRDVILLYFENKRRSGGGEVEKVEMVPEERYCLVYFEDNSVIDRVLSQTHKIDGADVKVHLHHECLGRRSSTDRSHLCFKISNIGKKDTASLDEIPTENSIKETSSSISTDHEKESDFLEEPEWQINDDTAALDDKTTESSIKGTSGGISSDHEKESDFVEVPEWQINDGRDCVLSLLVQYRKTHGKKVVRDMKKVPCSFQFLSFWNFYTRKKQGQQMLNEILQTHCCLVTVSSEMDDMYLFEVNSTCFETESDFEDFLNVVLYSVYMCAQQSLFSDAISFDHRMHEDVQQRVNQTKDLDCAWIELIGEHGTDAICVVCTDTNKMVVLHVVTEIIADAKKCFENHEEVVFVDLIWHRVMTKFGYVKNISDKFPHLTITTVETSPSFVVKGQRDDSKAAADDLTKLLETAHMEIQEDIFSPGCHFEILTYPAMQDYINNCITLPSTNFIWMPNPLTENVHIFYRKSEVVRGLGKLIKGCIKEKAYVFAKEDDMIKVEKSKSVQDLKDKYKGKTVIYSAERDTLVATAADDIFESLDAEIQEIIKNVRAQSSQSACPLDKLITQPDLKAPESLKEKEELHLRKDIVLEETTVQESDISAADEKKMPGATLQEQKYRLHEVDTKDEQKETVQPGSSEEGRLLVIGNEFTEVQCLTKSEVKVSPEVMDKNYLDIDFNTGCIKGQLEDLQRLEGHQQNLIRCHLDDKSLSDADETEDEEEDEGECDNLLRMLIVDNISQAKYEAIKYILHDRYISTLQKQIELFFDPKWEILYVKGRNDEGVDQVAGEIRIEIKKFRESYISIETRQLEQARNIVMKMNSSSPVKSVFCYISEKDPLTVHFVAKTYEDIKQAKQKLQVELGKIRFASHQKISISAFDDKNENEHLASVSSKLSPQDASRKSFTTAEGIRVFVYECSILQAKVDVIVNAANEDLKHTCGISKVIADAAGAEFIKESEIYIKENGKLTLGATIITSGGKLNFPFIIHTVGPRWEKYSKTPEGIKNCMDDLWKAVIGCFFKAQELCVQSVALPAISSGMLWVPFEICARQYLKAVMAYSKATQGTGSLKEIHFVDVKKEILDLIALVFSATLENNQVAAEQFNDRMQTVLSGFEEPSTQQTLKSVASLVKRGLSLKKQKSIFKFTGTFKVLIYTGDITDSKCKVIVCSEDKDLKSQGGVAMAIRRKAGQKYEMSLGSHRGRVYEVGDAIDIDAAGELKCQKVICCIVPKWTSSMSDEEYKRHLGQCFRNILEKAKAYKSVATPLIGIGFKDKSIELCGRVLLDCLLKSSKAWREKEAIRKVHIVSPDDGAIACVKSIFMEHFDADCQHLG